jgi:hypothetical protein
MADETPQPPPTPRTLDSVQLEEKSLDYGTVVETVMGVSAVVGAAAQVYAAHHQSPPPPPDPPVPQPPTIELPPGVDRD